MFDGNGQTEDENRGYSTSLCETDPTCADVRLTYIHWTVGCFAPRMSGGGAGIRAHQRTEESARGHAPAFQREERQRIENFAYHTGPVCHDLKTIMRDFTAIQGTR
jgi:hypothetical protein